MVIAIQNTQCCQSVLNHAFTYLRPYTDDTSVAIYAD